MPLANASAYVGFEITYPNPDSFLESPFNLDPSGISSLTDQEHSRKLGSIDNIFLIYKNFGLFQYFRKLAKKLLLS